MAERNYTPHQQQIIRRYYEHQPQLLRQRLAELVGNVFLAQGKKRQRLWKDAGEILGKLGLPPARIEHILKQADPALLAEVVKEQEA